jgi:hypothetical protein
MSSSILCQNDMTFVMKFTMSFAFKDGINSVCVQVKTLVVYFWTCAYVWVRFVCVYVSSHILLVET